MIFTTHLSALCLFNLSLSVSSHPFFSPFLFAEKTIAKLTRAWERRWECSYSYTNLEKDKKHSIKVDQENAKLSPIWGSIWNSRECIMELQLNLIRSGGLHNVRSLIFYNSPVRLLLFWSHCISSECGSIRRSHVLNETVSKDNQREPHLPFHEMKSNKK